MVSLKEKFNFLEDGVDFPFYNGIPKLSTVEWLILIIPVIIMLILISTPEIKSSQYFSLIFFFIMVIPALYVCKGNYSLFFKKPKKRDILTIILCLIGYYVYIMVVSGILALLGVPVSANSVLTQFSSPNAFLIISVFTQLLGEEFFKIFLLLIILYVVYKLTNNRGLAMTLGVILTLFLFGIIHAGAYSGRILQILLIQGFGSVFDLYAYMKTKNVVVSYILHLLIDFIPFTIMMLKVM